VSLATQADYDVDLVGLSGTDSCKEVEENPNIRKRLIRPIPVPWILDRIYPTRAIFKALIQALQFFWVLFWVIPTPKYILVQTPPALPILLLAHVVCFLRRSRLVIDWHNYGYTWLATAKPNARLFIQIYQVYERFFGRGAHANFCVSKAMQKDLAENWGIQAKVLYDRAPAMFKETPPAEKQKVRSPF
jgi:beta-1,4-mannosyltransferase